MQPIILFDGVCNYCNRVVNFIIRQDIHKKLLFAPLQSNAGIRLLKQFGLNTSALDSFVLIADGKAYLRSTAGLKLYGMLPWYWKWTQIFWIVPKRIRDAVYDFVARNRYRWFGKRDECMIPTEELKHRFLPN